VSNNSGKDNTGSWESILPDRRKRRLQANNKGGSELFMSKTIIEKNTGGSLAVRNIANGAEFGIEV
jgi:hypothetical protein